MTGGILILSHEDVQYIFDHPFESCPSVCIECWDRAGVVRECLNTAWWYWGFFQYDGDWRRFEYPSMREIVRKVEASGTKIEWYHSEPDDDGVFSVGDIEYWLDDP